MRIDSANDYFNLAYVATAIHDAGVPRSSIFLTSKIGSNFAMGYNESLQRESCLRAPASAPSCPTHSVWPLPELDSVLSTMSLTYVDALLIHWPTSTAHSSDPQCNSGPEYNATACRLRSVTLIDDGRSASPCTHIRPQHLGRGGCCLQCGQGPLHRREQLQL